MAEKDQQGGKEQFLEIRIRGGNNYLSYLTNMSISCITPSAEGNCDVTHCTLVMILLHLMAWWRVGKDAVGSLQRLFTACYSFQAFINVKQILMKTSSYAHSTDIYLFQKSH